MLTKQWTSRLGAAGLAALLVAGCSPSSTGGGLVTVQVSLARLDAAPSAAPSLQDVTAGSVDSANVSALDMTLDSVQLQTSESEGWQTVKQTAPLTLDLKKDLSGQPIDLGTVTLQAGACQARLFVSQVKITFKEDVVVGPGTTFSANTAYDVRIPSGDQTGLKPDGACQVTTSGSDVTLGFDLGATVVTIVATGNGILLTPVIHIVSVP